MKVKPARQFLRVAVGSPDRIASQPHPEAIYELESAIENHWREEVNSAINS
jgi:hypothetical protein